MDLTMLHSQKLYFVDVNVANWRSDVFTLTGSLCDPPEQRPLPGKLVWIPRSSAQHSKRFVSWIRLYGRLGRGGNCCAVTIFAPLSQPNCGKGHREPVGQRCACTRWAPSANSSATLVEKGFRMILMHPRISQNNPHKCMFPPCMIDFLDATGHLFISFHS